MSELMILVALCTGCKQDSQGVYDVPAATIAKLTPEQRRTARDMARANGIRYRIVDR